MKNTICFLIFFVNSFSISYSQVNEEWVRLFAGKAEGYDSPVGIVVDNSGNVFTGGVQESISITDFITIKYDANGVEQWERTYSGGIEDRMVDIGIDNSGNVYVTGITENQTGTYDFITIKYNTAGDSVWVRRYNGSYIFSMDLPTAIFVDENDFIYVTGYTFGGGDFVGNVTIKYNTGGDSLWVARTFNGTPQVSSDIYVDAQGNSYVSVRQSGTTIIKHDPDGNLIWMRSYPVDAGATNKCMTGDNSGNIYFIGARFTSTFNDFATVKINSEGDTLWVRTYNGLGTTVPRHDETRAIAIDHIGNVFITGESQFSSSYFFCTIKYDPSGTFQWERNYSHPLNGDGGNDIKTDAGGNVYVTGGSNDFTTIKYNTTGDVLWTKFYDGQLNLNDFSSGLTLDETGNVYVTGRSRGQGSSSNFNIVTIKYSQTITNIASQNENPGGFKLHQNYPNPFNPKTVIGYELPASHEGQTSANVIIRIYDMNGKEIAVLVNERKDVGSHSVQWDASDYPSGIYFYRLVIQLDDQASGKLTGAKKMILLK